MGGRKVFLKEYNCFGEEHTINLHITPIELFLKLLTKEELLRLLETQIQEEKYELAELINDELKLKNNP